MGTDTIGKREIDPALFARAAVFTDEVAQSVTIGEAQHAVAQGLIVREDITPLGAVVTGAAKGRVSPDQITIFDGTGVGLQDLAVAQTALSRARAQGLGSEVVF
jgi:ornithine cyclodeaminase